LKKNIKEIKIIIDTSALLDDPELLNRLAKNTSDVDILPTAKAGGFCGQTAIAAEGSLTSPSARENALSLWKF